MMKNFILGALLVSSLSFAQVGINTPNPQATLHVDGAKDNPATGTPTAAQQANDFAVTSPGNVGIGTAAPAEKLDVASGNVRIRAINSNVASGSYNIVAADANGVLKIANSGNFPTSNSGNRVLRTGGGSDWIYNTNWTNNTETILLLDEIYDPFNGYNPVTGVFTVQQDGLYYIQGRIRLRTDGSGTFNGDGGLLITYLNVNNTNIALSEYPIFRGAFISNGVNDRDCSTSFTAWLKAGQTVSLNFRTYGTMNMAATASGIRILRAGSFLIINKLL